MEVMTDEEVRELLGLEPLRVKQVIVIRKDLKMRRGKEVSQGAHASIAWLTNRLEASKNVKPEWIEGRHLASAVFTDPEWQWIQGNFRKICCVVNSEEELTEIYRNARDAGLAAEIIEDSGLTEFGGVPTLTAAAIGPDYDEKIDPITGHLALY